VTLFITVHS